MGLNSDITCMSLIETLPIMCDLRKRKDLVIENSYEKTLLRHIPDSRTWWDVVYFQVSKDCQVLSSFNKVYC